MPRGLISNENEINKIGKGGGGGQLNPLGWRFRSLNINFQKKHVELSSFFSSPLIFLWMQPLSLPPPMLAMTAEITTVMMGGGSVRRGDTTISWMRGTRGAWQEVTAWWEAEVLGRWEAAASGEAMQQPTGGLEALEGHDGRQEATMQWEAEDSEDAMAMMRRRMVTTVLMTTAVACLCNGDCTTTMEQQSGWPATAECNRCATHPRQQPINCDSLGRRRGERGEIWGDQTTDKGRGGGDLVEKLEPHIHPMISVCSGPNQRPELWWPYQFFWF